MALRHKHYHIQKILKETDIPIKKKLVDSCIKGDSETVKDIIRKVPIDINFKDYHNYTPLHYAMRNNHPTIVSTLLDCEGINLEVLDNQGNS